MGDQLLLIVGGALAVAVAQLVTRIFDSSNVRRLTEECKAARDDLYEQANRFDDERSVQANRFDEALRELIKRQVDVEREIEARLSARIRALEESIS